MRPLVVLFACTSSAFRVRTRSRSSPLKPQHPEVEAALAAAEQDAGGDCAPVSGSAAQINAQLRKRDSEHPQGKVRPCGYYRARCPTLAVIDKDVDYPGSGPGDLMDRTDYIVQFDVGTASPASDIPAPVFSGGEECLEVILTTEDNWGSLGVPGIENDAYNCMGKCGIGCGGVGNAWDCAKHDVCSAYKSIHMNGPSSGFCSDADCGDEAAQTVFNCRHLTPPWNTGDPFTPASCNCTEERATDGMWDGSLFFFDEGNCRAWQGCQKGEGIPSNR